MRWLTRVIGVVPSVGRNAMPAATVRARLTAPISPPATCLSSVVSPHVTWPRPVRSISPPLPVRTWRAADSVADCRPPTPCRSPHYFIHQSSRPPYPVPSQTVHLTTSLADESPQMFSYEYMSRSEFFPLTSLVRIRCLVFVLAHTFKYSSRSVTT